LKHLIVTFAGFKIGARLGWIIQELPSFLVAAGFLYEKWPHDVNWTQTLLIGMFTLHYFNRSFIFPFQIKQGRDTSLAIVASAFTFTLYNGFIQSHYILYVVNFAEKEIFSPTFIAGTIIFFIGMSINLDADHRLRCLRSERKPEGEPQERYKIPYGGMFNYVSSANYFGEIVEWWGFALAARFTPAALLFAGFTTMFLGMRGIHNHQWYKERFGQRYPTARRAVIPMIL